MKKYFAIFSLLLFSALGFSQEIITELGTNPAIKTRKDLPELLKAGLLEPVLPVTLPFFDDFSSREIYPVSLRWQDQFAYINTDYAINPPNIGVATLDAINEKGEIYAGANPGPGVFLADKLTSRPIRLDSVFTPVAKPLTPADSVYLSFFYQPQGRGNAPEQNDLLVLEFGFYTGDSLFLSMDSIDYVVEQIYNPGDSLLLPCLLPEDSVWVSVNPYLQMHGSSFQLLPGDVITLPCDSIFEAEIAWKIEWFSTGTELDTNFYVEGDPLTYFRRVMVPIKNEVFFRSDFLFRFKNFVSLADNSLPSWQSNADHWNIDFVYLNFNRTWKDTTYKALSFVDRVPSMIRKYESMPYNQYTSDPTNIMKDSIDIVITNMDTLEHNTSYRYVLYDQTGNALDSCMRGNWDIPPVYETGYLDYINFNKPPVCFGFFPVDFYKDSALFIIKHFLTTGTSGTGDLNDTLVAEQFFSNYFAYDDGSAEAGYGLTPSGSQLAYLFNLNEPDTLRAIQMYFNETRTSSNNQPFYMAVWKDNNGKPGELIYSQQVKSPEFTKELNKFYTYELDTALPVTSLFYIGWIQTTDDNLNIGFDRHNQAQEYMYYNVTGEWIQSIQKGSLMMRPVVGKSLKDEEPDNPPSENSPEIEIHPNPVKSGAITILLPLELSDPDLSAQISMDIFNLMGQKVFSGPYTDTLDITNLRDGLYILTVRGNTPNQFYTGKLMIIR
jgi:hypothetical protein